MGERQPLDERHLVACQQTFAGSNCTGTGIRANRARSPFTLLVRDFQRDEV
jgi:hypothetical protein